MTEKPTSTKSARSRSAAARRRRAARRNPLAGQQTFLAALREAERRLPEAVKEQAEALAQYTMLGGEIEQLRTMIRAFSQQPMMPGYYYPPALPQMPAPPQPVTMARIMSDEPLPTTNRPVAQPLPVPHVELPFTPGRGGGAAMDTNIAPVEDEDEHLKSSAMAGGSWV